MTTSKNTELELNKLVQEAMASKVTKEEFRRFLELKKAAQKKK